MDPDLFVSEVYRRMIARHSGEHPVLSWERVKDDASVVQLMDDCRSLLPTNTDAAILDVGFGSGWFLGACVRLGYTNLSGADFGIEHKSFVSQWSPAGVKLYEIETTIADFLSDHREQFDFIHLSHVIEHIPKYTLLYLVDAIYAALKPGGTVMLRTPNMEGPCANSSYYVTLSHEYGFAGANLCSLLDVCNFDDIRLHDFSPPLRSAKQIVGWLIRGTLVRWNAARHRLFGVNHGGIFGQELVATAKRGNRPPLLDERCK